MLVLSRRLGEKICFPDIGLVVQVVSLKGGRVRLGVEAPAEVAVLREEVLLTSSPQTAPEPPPNCPCLAGP